MFVSLCATLTHRKPGTYFPHHYKRNLLSKDIEFIAHAYFLQAAGDINRAERTEILCFAWLQNSLFGWTLGVEVS